MIHQQIDGKSNCWNVTMKDTQARGLLSPREAANYLQISTKTLIALVNDGAIRAIDVGRGRLKRRYRFTEGDLGEFVDLRAQRDVPCRSTSTKTVRSTISTSNSNVLAFTALRDARMSGTPRPSNDRNATKPSSK